MRSQIEKNREILLEDIEKYGCKPMTQEVARYLDTCYGAFKALCIAEKAENYAGISVAAVETEDKPARTPELDGDTEFERVIMTVPLDRAHMLGICGIFADHMETLSIVNRRAYDNILMRLREVARS